MLWISWPRGYASRLLYQWFSVRLVLCRLPFCFFFTFFRLRCYVWGLGL